MADAQARKTAIKKASSQVRTGGVFVRRASAAAVVLRSSTTVKTSAKKSR
jgi:hypothetical protein